MTKNRKSPQNRTVTAFKIFLVLAMLSTTLFWTHTRADDGSRLMAPPLSCGKIEDAKAFLEAFIAKKLVVTTGVRELMTAGTCGKYVLWTLGPAKEVFRYEHIGFGENGVATLVLKRVEVDKVALVIDGHTSVIRRAKSDYYFFAI